MDIIRIPTISTSHITEVVSKQLTLQRDGNPWCTCYEGEYGYFLYLEELTEANTPQCLEDICAWLKKHNYKDCWVRLDCDADPVPDLPTYDW